jgi:hypothetical protein
MGLLDGFGFDNIELWRSEEMQLVQVRSSVALLLLAEEA